MLLNFLLIETAALSQTTGEKSNLESKDSTESIYEMNDKEEEQEGESKFIIYSDSGKAQLNIYGEVRVNGALDLNGLQASETFDIYNILVDSPDSYDKRFFLGVFESRIGLKANLNTPAGEMEAKIEGDFNGSNNTFRIRKAYAKIRNILAGKTSSLFGDPDAMSIKVDRDGPNFALSERTIQINYQNKIKKSNIDWGVALENPEADITNPLSSEIDPYYQSIPEFVSYIRKNYDNGGHLRLAGILRNITVRNPDQSLQIIQGFGGLFSGHLRLAKKYSMYFQLFAGQSIANYVQSFSGNGQDVVYDTISNFYEPINLFGGFVTLTHYWSEKLSTDITYGLSQIENVPSEPANIFKIGYYASGNFFVKATKSSEAGIEYSFGKKVSPSAGYGTANRISFILYYYF